MRTNTLIRVFFTGDKLNRINGLLPIEQLIYDIRGGYIDSGKFVVNLA